MASVSVPGGGGGKRKVDVNIELVPFIDMLAMMITFLMMTAVWTQLGKIQVSQAAMGGSESSTPPRPTLQLNLTMTERSYLLLVGSEMKEIPKTPDGSFDTAKLVEELKAVKKDYPDHRSITIAAEDGILYQHLVLTVDKCIEAGFPDVSVTAALG